MDMHELIAEQMRSKLTSHEAKSRKIAQAPTPPERQKRSSRLLNLFNR